MINIPNDFIKNGVSYLISAKNYTWFIAEQGQIGRTDR